MTNREYLNTLSDNDFAKVIADTFSFFQEKEYFENPLLELSELQYNAMIDFKLLLAKEHKQSTS